MNSTHQFSDALARPRAMRTADWGPHERIKGFTLAELLVVIAIIVVLIALLLPAMLTARRQAMQIQCQANLRQIGHAMMMYTNQYQHFPVTVVNLSPTRSVQCWPVRLRRFLNGNQRVFYCPAQDARCQWAPDGPGLVAFAQLLHTHFGYEQGERLLVGSADEGVGTANGMFFSYGANSLGALETTAIANRRGMGMNVYDRFGKPLQIESRRISSVRSSSNFILLADSSPDGAGDMGVFPRNTVAGLGFDNSPGSIHRGGANVLFCDGHVQWFLKRDLVVRWPVIAEEGAKQRMWNIDNRPAKW